MKPRADKLPVTPEGDESVYRSSEVEVPRRDLVGFHMAILRFGVASILSIQTAYAGYEVFRFITIGSDASTGALLFLLPWTVATAALWRSETKDAALRVIARTAIALVASVHVVGAIYAAPADSEPTQRLFYIGVGLCTWIVLSYRLNKATSDDPWVIRDTRLGFFLAAALALAVSFFA